jgi:oligopeptide transport system permease protein
MKYAVQRLVLAIPLLLLLGTLAFALLRTAPGGPFDPHRVPAPSEIEEALQERHFLNEPIWKQHLRYLGLLWEWYPHDGWVHAQTGLIQLDPGPSLHLPASKVIDLLAEAIRVSLALGFLTFALAIGLGIPGGVLLALPPGRWLELPGSLAALLAMGLLFVFGPILAMPFVCQLEGFPSALASHLERGLWAAGVVGLFAAGRIARLIRGGLRAALQAPFVVTARAKGISEAAVLWGHAFRPAVLPVLSRSASLWAMLLTGMLVVENVWQLPGLGTLLVHSALDPDYPMLVNVVLLYAVAALLLNGTADLLHRRLDPRMPDAYA